MTYLEDAALRREMWTAAAAVGTGGPHDNTTLIARILALRGEKASLLGYAHFADFALERRMAKSGAQALAFIEDLQRRAADAFARETRELEEFKAQQSGTPIAPLAPWEIGFWSEKLRRARYDFDEEVLRPFFAVDRVIAGLFELVQRVFGLRVVEHARGEVETWHREVGFYDLFDGAGRPLGSFYADWHPRESKRGGAWMNYLITGGPLPGGVGAAPGPAGRPERTTSRLLPSLEMSALTFSVVPEPMVSMAMTAATPMTMPSNVRNERSTLRRIERSERRTVSRIMVRAFHPDRTGMGLHLRVRPSPKTGFHLSGSWLSHFQGRGVRGDAAVG